MTTYLRSTLLFIISGGFLAGCIDTVYTPTPFTPATVDTSAYVPKVDAFVVVVDASDSMNFYYGTRRNFFTAKDVVGNMNQTIPPLGYKSALVGFGTGSCVNGEDATVLYGPAPYRRADFANGLAKLDCAGGLTPMSEGIDVGGGSAKAASGKVAMILVSDFYQIDTGAVSAVVDKLKADYGDRLCIHTIRVADAPQNADMIAALAGVNSCGSSVDASSLATPDAMANYVTDVLLTPAAVTAVKYEKTTVSASALFDYDKAILKDKGKAELHALDESIKARGAKIVDVHVIGYTDSEGTEKYNMALSLRRADAVRNYMVSEGVASSMIKVSGEGESNPVASNATAEGRAQNRRVEIHVGVKQPS